MTERSRVFVTRVIPAAGLDLVREAADAEVWPDELPPPREILIEKVRGLDGLLSLLTDRVDDELLASLGDSGRGVFDLGALAIRLSSSTNALTRSSPPELSASIACGSDHGSCNVARVAP